MVVLKRAGVAPSITAEHIWETADDDCSGSLDRDEFFGFMTSIKEHRAVRWTDPGRWLVTT